MTADLGEMRIEVDTLKFAYDTAAHGVAAMLLECDLTAELPPAIQRLADRYRRTRSHFHAERSRLRTLERAETVNGRDPLDAFTHEYKDTGHHA